MPALAVERDYVLAHVIADIGAHSERRLVFKGGTLLRLCCFENYRYSADLDFSAIDGLSRAEALTLIAEAAAQCRKRLEMPTLDVEDDEGQTSWLTYVGPLDAKPRRLKLDVSENELVEGHHPVPLQQRWPDLPVDATVEGYTLIEVGAEKLRCIAERVECRDLYDVHELLDGKHFEPLEAWELYLRKAANDVANGKVRTPPQKWAEAFERRLTSYKRMWDNELSNYVPGNFPRFDDVERRSQRWLADVIAAARKLTPS